MIFRPVTILGCGMMTGVGLTAPSSCAAIRAHIDNFHETRFIASGGEWVIGSTVPLEEPWRGLARLAQLVAGPVRECLCESPGLRLEEVPLFLCVVDPDRPGRMEGLGSRLLNAVAELLGVICHPASRVFEQGPVGAASAIVHASQLIYGRHMARVLIVGVDSLLETDTLRALDARDRLLTPSNSNGLLPGEAGAALLVGPVGAGPGLDCVGLGFAVEKATLASGEPSRAEGLRVAMAAALAQAGIAMNQIGYRIADLNGEQYGFREADLAVTRLLRGRHDFQDLWHPADCVGAVGAAALPVMLGVALTAARKGYAAGDPVLAHASNDDGRRAAAVLTARGNN